MPTYSSRALRLAASALLGCAVLLFAWVPGFAQQASPARVGSVSFIAGVVEILSAQGTRTVAVGDPILEGDAVRTGVGGHLHIKTVDNGFLAVRPMSKATIETYQFDPRAAESTRIRLRLESGVMRTVSGEGAQRARENFRLNTPVAAIGIRGTDFTVSTTDTLTRAVVASGAIVVSAFGDGCRVDGLGPCAGSFARSLSASEVGKLLELRRGDREPAILDVRGTGATPDQSAPPAPSEPKSSTDKGTSIGQQGVSSTSESKLAGQVGQQVSTVVAAPVSPPAASVPASVPETAPVASKVPAAPVQPAPEPAAAVPPVATGSESAIRADVAPMPPASTITWGRWQAVANMPAPVDPDAFLAQAGKLVGVNSMYLLARTREDSIVLPVTGRFDFRLDRAEAFLVDSGAGTKWSADVNSGTLSVDFGAGKFSTQLDVRVGDNRYALSALGRLTDGAILSGNMLYADGVTNMTVRGALAGRQGDLASYLFDYAISVRQSIVGATSWSR